MKIDGNKKIYGLIGWPVEHSLSQKMQEAAFSYCGIPAEYKLIPVRPEDLEDFILYNKKINDTDGKTVSLADLSGFNVTIPHKVELMPKRTGFIEGKTIECDLTVLLAGAINTVKIDGNTLSYYNTDAKGFFESLREDLKFNPDGKNIFLFGCGGAGRAVIAGLMPQAGFQVKKIYVYDVNKETMESAKKHFYGFDWIEPRLKFITQKEMSSNIKEYDLLVNASPVGMKEGDGSVIDKTLLRKELFVYDIVYNRETQLIRNANAVGAPAVNGIGMLLYQGVASFELFTGRKAPVSVMRAALKKAVTRCR